LPVRMYIAIDLEKCTGCGICEEICSWVKFNEFNRTKAAIRVDELDNFKNSVVACMNCEDAPCVEACVVKKALEIDKYTIKVDYDKCNFCGWCIDACEYGAITIDYQTKKLVFCDLCQGEEVPRCVALCPKEAISLKEVPKKEESKKVSSDMFF